MIASSKLLRRVWVITLLLIVAVALRLIGLTRLPPGFSDAEITNIYLAEVVREGSVASFYNVGDPAGDHEGLFPILESLVTGILGDGILPYRALSLWCGLLSVALIYVLARRLFGGLAGLIAACALVVTLWPILLSRTAIREALLLPLVIAALLALVTALHVRRRIHLMTPVTSAYAGFGVFVALMAYTHWSGLLIIPLFVVFIIYLITTRQPISRRVLSFSVFALLVAFIVGIPYIVIAVRGLGLSGAYYLWSQRPEDLGSLVRSFFQTLASLVVTGDPRPDHNLPGAPLIGPLGGALLVIGLIEAVRRWRSPNAALILLLFVFGLGVDVWTRGAPDFTHLILAIPAIMALIGLGAASVMRALASELRRVFPVNLAALVLALVSIVLAATTLFRDWANRRDVDMAFNARLGRVAAYLDRAHDNLTTSICTFNLRTRTPLTVDAGRRGGGVRQILPDPLLLDFMMHRKDVSLRFSNCLTGIVLAGGGARQRFAYADPQAPAHMSPILKSWLANARPVKVDGLPDGTILEVDATEAVANAFGQAISSRVEWAPESAGPSDRAALPLRMGGYLTFEGYRYFPPGPYRSRDTLTIVTYWRADGIQVPGLQLFVHVLRNPYAEPVLQNDILSVDSRYLRDRDVFMQVVDIPLPPAFPPGEYFVSVGAYSTESASRLPVYDENRERGNRLFLDKIAVN